MNNSINKNFQLLLISFLFIVPSLLIGANRSSIGVSGGIGVPVGWWADRWDLFQSGEINVRYEFTPGTGIQFITGLGKAYLTEMSVEEVSNEARVHNLEEFDGRREILEAYQGGSFKQIPVGFGIYTERLLATYPRQLRGYASASMIVYLWQAERSQGYYEQVTGLNGQTNTRPDNWQDSQDGSNLGFQLALGVVYPLTRKLHLDVSTAYQFVDISRKHGATVYWGLPARTWDGDQISDASGRTDILQIRIGIRYGS